MGIISSSKRMVPPDPASEETLLAQLRLGDRDAFQGLYLRHVEATFRYAFAIVRNEDDAEEVTQESWVTLWNSRGRLRDTMTSALPWLLVTVRHTALKQRRSSARRVTRDASAITESAPSDPSLTIEAEEFQSFIAGVVAAMQPLDRGVFLLCVSEGLSYRAASQRLGVTEGVVRNRVHRLRRKLQNILTEREGAR